MASANEFLLLLNASCGPCADLGPPPDAILRIPPPPLPAFLQRAPPPPPPPPPVVVSTAAEDAVAAVAGLNATSAIDVGSTCSAQCEWGAAGPGGVQYVELPRQGPAAGDTWLLVLIASSAGVLLLGALLALLLLKCRVQRAGKAALHLEPSALRHAKSHGGGASAAGVAGGLAGSSGGGGPACSGASSALGPTPAPCAAVGLYPSGGIGCVGSVSGGGGRRSCSGGGGSSADGRVLWAALTPRGTTRHHFARPPLSPAPASPAPIYEAPIYEAPPGPPLGAPLGAPLPPPPRCASFDNSAYVEEAAGGLAALVGSSLGGGGGGGESFPLAERCSPVPPPRPRVSSPTRIEHPNLPPLNLLPTLPRARRAAPVAPTPAAPSAHALGPMPGAPVVL